MQLSSMSCGHNSWSSSPFFRCITQWTVFRAYERNSVQACAIMLLKWVLQIDLVRNDVISIHELQTAFISSFPFFRGITQSALFRAGESNRIQVCAITFSKSILKIHLVINDAISVHEPKASPTSYFPLLQRNHAMLPHQSRWAQHIITCYNDFKAHVENRTS